VNAEPLPDGGRRDVQGDGPRATDAAHSDGGCDSGDPGVKCLAVADSTHLNGAITVDEKNVYWAASGQTPRDDVVMSVPRAGGAAVTLAHGSANALVSDGVSLYWTDWSAGLPATTGTIQRVPVAGGPVTRVATANSPNCIAVDETRVYWSEVMTGGLVAVATEGGTPTTLAHAMAGLVAAPVVLDATNIYWAPASLMKVSKSGGSATPVWEDVPANTIAVVACRALAVVGATLVFNYEIGQGPALIGTIPVTGAANPTVIVSAADPAYLVTSATNVFWVGHTSANDIDEMPLQGGSPVTLSTPPDPQINDIVLASDGTLYWTGDFQIQSLKP
jgi:hypothetical protein